MPATYEVHLPISPTPAFFNMVHYYAASLRENGGAAREARIVVSIGADCEPFDVDSAYPVLAPYDIAWRWVDRAAFRQYTYFATGLERWAKPFTADYVIMADADTLVVRDFTDAADGLPGGDGVTGVMATFPPFMARGEGNVDTARWQELFRVADLGEPPQHCEYPGFDRFYLPSDGCRFGPPYYNFAFVFGSARAMNAIRSTFAADYYLALDFVKSDLSAQVALTLALFRHRLPFGTLPIRYNFWGWQEGYDAFPEDRECVKILHYLMGPFLKHRDSDSPATVDAWLAANGAESPPLDQLIAGCLAPIHRRVLSDYRGLAA